MMTVCVLVKAKRVEIKLRVCRLSIDMIEYFTNRERITCTKRANKNLLACREKYFEWHSKVLEECR